MGVSEKHAAPSKEDDGSDETNSKKLFWEFLKKVFFLSCFFEMTTLGADEDGVSTEVQHRSVPKRSTPPCYKCGAVTFNDGSCGYETKQKRRYIYRYKCTNTDCGALFRQPPPDLIGEGESYKPTDVHKRKNMKGGGQYICRKCGQPKKGHVCSAAPSKEDDESDETARKKHKASVAQSAQLPLPPHVFFPTLPPLTGDIAVGEMEGIDLLNSAIDLTVCLKCEKPGSMFDSENALLHCSKCGNLAIHVNCLPGGCVDSTWFCPACES